jgi:hypothetical protein
MTLIIFKNRFQIVWPRTFIWDLAQPSPGDQRIRIIDLPKTPLGKIGPQLAQHGNKVSWRSDRDITLKNAHGSNLTSRDRRNKSDHTSTATRFVSATDS